ncbi:hypothetical protein [Tissierella praeacuta]|uniref:hypothetical protein n=1 Tax=Tissierella praeacuta TaxID=43131 RepID=UPI003340C84C
MAKGIIGSISIFISAILYSTKYLSAAIAGINSNTWGKGEFLQYLSYTPNLLNTWIYISFIIGIILLAWYSIDSFKK